MNNPSNALSRPGILHIAPDLESGWAGREVVDLAIQTHRAGWRPFVASAGGALVLEAERAAVRHRRIPQLSPGSLWGTWRAARGIDSFVVREQPVLVHAHGFDSIALALRTGARFKIPVLLDLADPAPVTSARKKLLALAVQRKARFRVPSDFMVRHLRQDFQLATAYLYRIPPGVDLQWFEASRVTPERLQALSQAWRLPEQANVILMATPMKPGFGHTGLLESFAALGRDDVYLVLVGGERGGSLRGAIEKDVLKYGLGGKVVMPEFCADWPAACWLSSLVVANNAMPRGQAMELLAAQALGRPVIVTDCGANIEMAGGDQTAWVVAAGDREGLTEALREAVCLGPDRRIEIAQTTRAFIGDFFPMEFWRDAMFDLYGAMLSLPMPTMEAWAA